MKKMNLIISILALSLIGMGCSKKTSVHQDPSLPLVPDVIDPDDVIPDDGVTGTNTVTLNTTYSEMNAYVGIRPLNNPTDIKVTVDMTKDSRNRYSGTVVISYMDNGQRYQGVFNSGSAKNMTIKYSEGNGMYDHDYNYWWNDAGYSVFSGFLQDAYGGIVLVIDRVTTQGNNDGVGKTVLSGSIWYRNFTTTSAPQSPYRKCWYITKGPYDCRSSSVIHKNAIYPADTYRRLGTFTGLSKSAAFKSY